MSNTSQISASTSDNFLENLNDPKKIFFSYAVKIEPVNFSLLLEYFTSSAKDIFYYCEPEDKVSFLSFEMLNKDSFSFDKYESLSDKIAKIKAKLVSNHKDFDGFNLPVFITSVKFPLKKKSDEWSDFNDLDFLIPKIILFKKDESYFLISNFFSESFSFEQNFADFLENEANLIYDLEERLNLNNNKQTTLREIKNDSEISEWNNKVVSVLKEMKQDNIEKVVISRRVVCDIDSNINWYTIFEQLNHDFTSCANFLYKSGKSIFFGSTPEVLIKFSENEYTTEALAGSIKRGSSLQEDQNLENELLESEKNNVEHTAVIDYIKKSIHPYTDSFNSDKNPVVKKLPNIQHLQTSLSGTLKSKEHIFKVVATLFPTPAVCGIPKEKSLNIIRQNEDFDRGLFSGIIGWFNADYYGEFFVTIRSALIKDNKLYAYAGCGIVEGSDPKEEFDETLLKLKPILSLFSNADKN